MSQALRAAKLATDDEQIIRQVINRIGEMIQDIPMDISPPETGALIDRTVKKITKNPKLYSEVKKKTTRKALFMYPKLKEKINQSPDPLLTAVKLAIAGNAIDFGVSLEYNLEEEIKTVLNSDLEINDWALFKKYLNNCKEILYIGDNAGEAVLDRLLIEEMGKPTQYVVRGVSVINDVTEADARESGIHLSAQIISSGTPAPGTIRQLCNTDFLHHFDRATFIISKGQGNFEGLSEEQRPIFFLLKAKCPVVAHMFKANLGDRILKAAACIKK